MLQRTYDKVNALFEEAGGYLPARTLLANKITTIQIRSMLEDERIERISHGNYWNLMPGREKPKNYKMIEACMTNPKAVICALSACYYHGLVSDEPEKLYIATARTDRGGMKLTFPVSRHYFSAQSFRDDVIEKKTPAGVIRVYGLDRSVCDCIRLEREIGPDVVKVIVEKYKTIKRKKTKHLLEYADRMRFGKIARKYLEQ